MIKTHIIFHISYLKANDVRGRVFDCAISLKTRHPEKLPEAFSLFSYTVWINLTVYEQKGLVTALNGSHFIHISKSV